ncbi:MAG: ATP-dependent protease LonB [Nitrospiraceae bacterium]|nr:ATP-dependent protease LonB [Nitrospiraceae bacterium]
MGNSKKSDKLQKSVKNKKKSSIKAKKEVKKTIALKKQKTTSYNKGASYDDISLNFKTTADIKVPERMIDQVIGQEKAVEVIKKAANQRRHVLLIGLPGTGKSMLGVALAELLPKENLVDILAYPNPNDEFQPKIMTVKAGEGRKIIAKTRFMFKKSGGNMNLIIIIILILSIIAPWWIRAEYGDIMAAATMIGSWFLLGVFILFMSLNKKMGTQPPTQIPKLIVDNYDKKRLPFYDATGAHAGALLGDVLHDPFQSGGLGTPAHQRVIAGMIHKAHMGVLFIDEIATLTPQTQQELLTALQEGKYPITGQSERSAGAMVRTEPVPCDFILVAAGNPETVKHMHPALRSRIRGYGYEVYMEDSMKDTPENRKKIVQFVAQEVKKDGKIPHFTRDAVKEIIEEARRRASRKGYLSIMFRDLGGLIRTAGDLAKERGLNLVTAKIVRDSKKLAASLEQQIAEQYLSQKKQYEVIMTTGNAVGRVNGLAVMGAPPVYSGIILPIEAEVTKARQNSNGGHFTATGKLGKIAKEAVVNVSALLKKLFDEDLTVKNDVYIQFLQTYEGVEGDSASIAVAIAIISALKRIPIRQDVGMTGSLSVRGEILPIGGVSAKVEAAVDSGLKEVLVPYSNIGDIVLPKDKREKIKILPIKSLMEVLQEVFVWDGNIALFETIKKRWAKQNRF